jgi:CRISPR-associated protein Cmr4
MEERAYLLHALSPLHAGTGRAAEIIDLPIARMKSTGIPIVPGSSIKGVLRDACRDEDGNESAELKAVFGPDNEKAGDHAGALVVGDARLLALPVRSYKGVFAWVTCPLLLSLAQRDLGKKGEDQAIPKVGKNEALCLTKHPIHEDKVYLEELDLKAEEDDSLKDWSDLIANRLYPEKTDTFTKRFVVVDDDTMAFLWETATQVDTRVRIDGQTRTVARGALWLEESLPPETLLIGLLAADRSRKKDSNLTPSAVLDTALPKEKALQFGGKATVGRGRCRMIPLDSSGGE